jgi:hypothetical protein
MPKGRGSVKVKKVPVGNTEDINVLNSMFDQMTGVQGADVDIIIPKIVSMHGVINRFVRLYDLWMGFAEFTNNFSECADHFKDIKEFVDKVRNLINRDIVFTEKSLGEQTTEEVNALYKSIKTAPEIQGIIVTSGKLGAYKRYIFDKNDLRDDFIKREPGLTLIPFTFTNLDIKMLWVSDKLTNMAKKYILTVISHTYVLGHEMYDITTSPDIDIKKFSRVIISSIDKMRKQIPRCDKAFDIIVNSVNMLEDKFKGYYRTSVEASNPSIIIESFIVDVSMSQKSSATTTNQFRKIIMAMKRQTQNSDDPRVKQLFGMLNTQFNLMDAQTGGGGGGESNSDDTPTDDTNTENKSDDTSNSDETLDMSSIMKTVINELKTDEKKKAQSADADSATKAE